MLIFSPFSLPFKQYKSEENLTLHCFVCFFVFVFFFCFFFFFFLFCFFLDNSQNLKSGGLHFLKVVLPLKHYERTHQVCIDLR